MKLLSYSTVLAVLFSSYTLHGSQAKTIPARANKLMQAAPSVLYPIGAAICMTLGLTPNSKIPTRLRVSEETQWIALFVGCIVLIGYLRKLSNQAQSLQDVLQQLKEEVQDMSAQQHKKQQLNNTPIFPLCSSSPAPQVGPIEPTLSDQVEQPSQIRE